MSDNKQEEEKGPLQVYWIAYGGFTALFKSGYLWSALIITALLTPRWRASDWWQDPLNIMPDLLGFTLAGYAIWTAIGDEKFRAVLGGKDPNEANESPFMEVNAAFAHFVVLQLIALILGLLGKAYDFPLPQESVVNEWTGAWLPIAMYAGQALAYLTFVYALVLALAATMAIFQVSKWFDDYQSALKKQHETARKKKNSGMSPRDASD